MAYQNWWLVHSAMEWHCVPCEAVQTNSIFGGKRGKKTSPAVRRLVAGWLFSALWRPCSVNHRLWGLAASPGIPGCSLAGWWIASPCWSWHTVMPASQMRGSAALGLEKTLSLPSCAMCKDVHLESAVSSHTRTLIHRRQKLVWAQHIDADDACSRQQVMPTLLTHGHCTTYRFHLCISRGQNKIRESTGAARKNRWVKELLIQD